jgi:hypothetical protein
MGYNKIPLALRYNDTTNNAEGLIEFQLNLSDVGDVCVDEPGTGQALVRNASGDWCPSTLPAPGSFNGNLSDVGQVCSATPSAGQALVWSGSEWCPSTIPTGGGGGGGVTSVNGDTGPTVDLYLSSLSGIAFDKLGGDTGEGGGLLPQHIQWNGTNWVNAYEDEQYIRIKNRSGSELKAGQVVHIFNFQGDQAEVSLARADSSSTMPSIGVVYANILTDETGLAVTFGTASVDNSLTIDGSPNVGDVLYVSPTTSGSLTAIKPTGSSHLIQNVGVLLKAGSGAKVKVTGVGRANDIPNTLTLGATTITSASAKFANVDANSVVITNGASAVSSLSGASGSMVYFEGSPARPGTQSINQVLTNAGISFVNPSRILAYNTNSVTIAGENSSYPRWSVSSTNAVDQANSDITIGAELNSSGVTFNTAGDYQIDCAVTTSGTGAYTTNCLLAYDTGESGFTDISESVSYSYGSTSKSTAHITSIISAGAGSLIAVKVTPNSSVNLLTDGTTLRILRLS